MANSMFDKARRQIRFSCNRYDSLPMEPISQDLVHHAEELRKRIDERQAIVLRLRTEVCRNTEF